MRHHCVMGVLRQDTTPDPSRLFGIRLQVSPKKTRISNSPQKKPPHFEFSKINKGFTFPPKSRRHEPSDPRMWTILNNSIWSASSKQHPHFYQNRSIYTLLRTPCSRGRRSQHRLSLLSPGPTGPSTRLTPPTSTEATTPQPRTRTSSDPTDRTREEARWRSPSRRS